MASAICKQWASPKGSRLLITYSSTLYSISPALSEEAKSNPSYATISFDGGFDDIRSFW